MQRSSDEAQRPPLVATTSDGIPKLFAIRFRIVRISFGRAKTIASHIIMRLQAKQGPGNTSDGPEPPDQHRSLRKNAIFFGCPSVQNPFTWTEPDTMGFSPYIPSRVTRSILKFANFFSMQPNSAKFDAFSINCDGPIKCNLQIRLKCHDLHSKKNRSRFAQLIEKKGTVGPMVH